MGPQIQLSDFIGEHGSYQLTISLILFVRYVLLGLMANSGPLMTPDVTFYCRLPMDEVLAIMPNISTLTPIEQELEIREEFKRVCQLDLHLYQQTYLNATSAKATQKTINGSHISTGNSLGLTKSINSTTRIRECDDFTYDIAPDQGRTMTSEFDLVCESDWLRSLFQSLLSASIVIAHVFWGTFSDKYGRFHAQRLCLLVSLLAGSLSIFATDFWSFVVARALCSFGDLGLVVSLTTTVVELVGNRYRGLSVACVNFGYALGVALLPYIVAYFENFRFVVAFTVLCHIVTIPFILTTNESVRWLLTNRRYNSAKKELNRIVKWNRTSRIFRSKCCDNYHDDNCDEKEHTTGKNRKISSTTLNQAFERMFAKFVEQFESQLEFCDNLNTATPTTTTTTNVTTSEPDPQPHPNHNTIPNTQEPQEIYNDNSPANTPIVDQPPQIVIASYDNQSVHYEEQSKIEDNPIKSSNSTSCIDDHQARQQQSIVVPNCADGSSIPDMGAIKRANSCFQLESLLRPQLLEAFNKFDNLASDCPNKKNSTLPTLSRQSSRSGSFVMPHKQSSTTWTDLPLRPNQSGQQPDCINLVAHQLSFMGRVSRLFKDKQLMLVVFTLVWTTFNSELQYTSFIIINLEVGEDVYLNYIIGGCMEALAAVTASLLLSYSPRRQSLITFWLLISIFCFGLSWAHIDSHWAVWCLALAKFSQSSLSSIASVAAYESFPTSLRQSGSGLVFTLGMLGSVFAPLIFAEFDDHAGMDRVLMTFSFSSLTAAILIYKFLRETRDCELQ